jgi:capsular polysaccharide transport system permease protein
MIKIKNIFASQISESYIYSNRMTLFKEHPILAPAILAILLSSLYWLVFASDQYVSEAHIYIQRTEISGGEQPDIASVLSGATGVNRSDQLLLRDYLLSVDMLKILDKNLQLRAHFSSPNHDLLSRKWLKNSSYEQFYPYYKSKVNVELDDYAGVLVIKAQAYDAKMAHAIVALLVSEGERYMNNLAHNLAHEQLLFLEDQVKNNNVRALQARQALLNFQNKKGLASPEATAENVVAMIAKLEEQRAELETQRSALQSYLVADHPNIVQLNQQIAAVMKQIVLEQSKLTSTAGKTLNGTVEEYQRLEMEAVFTQDVYKTALVALEKIKVEVARTIKKISVLQSPTLPEYSIEPRRLYNTIVSILFVMMIAGMINLLQAIVRDHKD